MTAKGSNVDASDYTQYRPLMFSIAYRMTGSVSDAEDIVQEAFLRATKAEQPDNQKAYLATITTRLAIDHLRSARVRRESYVGTWLPEPLLSNGDADDAPGPAELAETSDSLSMAFLVLLESLSPPERAVFLLREVFGYGYPEIAEITGKTEAACRQIFVRARRRIDEGRPRFETSRAEGEELTSLFLAVARGGDMSRLFQRLAPDVLFYGDSGGRGEITYVEPVVGRDQVAEVVRIQLARTIELGASLHRGLGQRAAGPAGSATPTAASSRSSRSTSSTARSRRSGRWPTRRNCAISVPSRRSGTSARSE